MASFDIPNISFGGLASGLDTSSIIASLVAVERLPINLMEASKQTYQTKINAFGTFKNLLESLQTAVANLKDADDFKVYATSTSVDGILTATASGSAAPGEYQVEVFSLASNELEASQNFSDKDTTTLGTGTLSITVGTTETEITIASGQDTLEGIAAAINASDAEVTAAVINDGTGTPFRLTVSGNDTGAASAIVIDATGLTGGDAALSFTELKSAGNAHFEINGLEIYSAENTVASTLPGISLTLTGTTEVDTPITLSVERDSDAVKEKMQEFIDSYNGVIGFINTQNTFSEAVNSGGTLMGESLLRRVQTFLHSTLVPQWDESVGAPEVQILAQLGITFENNGQLSMDDSEFEEAVQDHFDDMVTMFAEDGFADTLDGLLEDYTKLKGSVDNTIDSLESIVSTMDKQIFKAEDRLSMFEANLIKKYTALETLMSDLNSQMTFLNSISTTQGS